MFDPEKGRKKYRNRSLLNLTDEGGDRTELSPADHGSAPDVGKGDTLSNKGNDRGIRIEAPDSISDGQDSVDTVDDLRPEPGQRSWIGRLAGGSATSAGNPESADPLSAEVEDDRLQGYQRRLPRYRQDTDSGPQYPGHIAESMTRDDNARPAAGESPLVDPSILLTTIWRLRVFIGLTTILGAVVGVMLALATPHEYLAISQFVYDPRQLRLTDTDFLPPSYSSESTLALVDSQVRIVDSVPVLESVVEQLDLADDPEFNGRSEAGLGSLLGMMGSLFSGSGDESEDRKILAVHNLARAVEVYRIEKTFIIQIAVTTRDPAKSAAIANSVLRVYIEQQNQAQSALYERTAESLTGQLEDLRRDVESAERLVEEYKAEHDIVGAGGSLIDEEQLVRLNEQLSEVRAQKAEIQAKAESARKLDVDEILSGTSEEILESATIGELRAEYAAAKRRFDTLSTSLGPRHPDRIAAAESLASARSEVSNELRRIVASTQTELRRAVQAEQQLAADLAVLKSRQMDTSADLVRLRELEREASATSAIYESSLKRTRETREQQKIGTNNIQIVAEATAPLEPAGPSRKLIAAAGTIGGFAFGMGITVLLGLYRGFIANNAGIRLQGRASQSRRVPAARVVEPDTRRYRAGNGDERETLTEAASDETAADRRYAARTGEPEHVTDEGPRHLDDDPESIREDIRDLKHTVERFRRARADARRERRNLPLEN